MHSSRQHPANFRSFARRSSPYAYVAAANRIQKQAPEFVAAHASLPWNQMRGMRNRMIHNYFDVNVALLWSTVKDHLPNLKQQIDALLIELKQDPGRER
jgi:uncharacterized protein with HEPN domain